MQESHNRPAYPTVGDPSFISTAQSGHTDRTAVSAFEPYVPPNVPHGLPHVVRYATLSSMDLPLEVRFLIIMIARFANVHGVASVANSTMGEICRIGSHHTVERWISLASDVGILRKEPGKGGKDRKSNSYTFLGEDRSWAPLPVGQPDTNPIVALAQARRIIEELQAELALLRNGHTNGHSEVTNGDGEPPAGPPSGSYGTPDSGRSQESHGAIGHSGVTNGSPEDPPGDALHSYENPDSSSSQGTHGAIGHSEVTNGSPEDPPERAPHSYKTPGSGSSHGTHGAIGHSEVTNGSPDGPPGDAPHSYDTPGSGSSRETHGTIGYSEVTNGPDGTDEGQEYLSRRARVQELVMNHRDYYQQSFDRRGVLGAIEYFSRSAENEQELMRQVEILDADGDPRQTGAGPPPEPGAQSQISEDSDRYGVGRCPDCGRPFATHGGAKYCTDCTERRRRESEA